MLLTEKRAALLLPRRLLSAALPKSAFLDWAKPSSGSSRLKTAGSIRVRNIVNDRFMPNTS
jgi:hypothetical protein